MPAKAAPTERLDIRFKAQGSGTSRSPSSDLWIWLIAGAVLGIGGWTLSRTLLTNQLKETLSSSSPGEAFLALESLLQLDEDAAILAVQGLRNSDVSVAKAAQRVLTSQIEKWKTADDEASRESLHALIDALIDLPEDTPHENLMIASQMASQVYTYCLDSEDASLGGLKRSCELVVRRAGSQVGADGFELSEEEYASRVAATQPPPPLPPIVATIDGGERNVLRLSDDNSSVPAQVVSAPLRETSYSASLSDSPEATQSGTSNAPGGASLHLVSRPTQQRQAEQGSASMSLSDGLATPTDQSVGQMPTHERAPSLGQSPPLETPATVASSVGTAPRLKMTVSAPAGLGDLPKKPDLEVVRFLGSAQPQVSQAATLELRSRGWPDRDIELAIELSTCSEARRLELVNQIAFNSELYPAPWLLWMAQDAEPLVRKTSVSLLSSMVDDNVERALRKLEGTENDASVRATIQQVLEARRQNAR